MESHRDASVIQWNIYIYILCIYTYIYIQPIRCLGSWVCLNSGCLHQFIGIKWKYHMDYIYIYSNFGQTSQIILLYYYYILTTNPMIFTTGPMLKWERL